MEASRGQQTAINKNIFVVDLLTTLQKDRFSPLAWRRFIQRSWNMSCETANVNPSLKHSWVRITMLMSVLMVGMCAAVYVFEGGNVALRLLPGFVFCVAWQQSDLFWHLGLNRQAQTGKLLQKVGAANILTGLRGLAASFLLSRLISGLTTPVWLALLVFLVGVVTDILDGLVARYTKMQSKLGQIADGEADFCLYLTLSSILVQNDILPLWLGAMLVLRFFVPLLAALISYFLFTHPVCFGSTVWGKYAGLAQCLYFFVLLAPPQFACITRFVSLPLLIVTLMLVVVAPAAQIVTNVHGR